MSTRIPLPLSLVLVAVLGACGGSGGGAPSGRDDGGGATGSSSGTEATAATEDRAVAGVAEPSPAPETREAVLLDAIVEGARYDAGAGVTGTTDARGVFRYRPGHPVAFFVGDLALGSAHPVARPEPLVELAADHVVTPIELAGEGASIDDEAVLNRVRLLMALDADGDAENGIRIPPSTRETMVDIATLDFSTAMDEATLVRAGLPAEMSVDVLPVREAAKAHLCRSLGRTGCADASVGAPVDEVVAGTDGAPASAEPTATDEAVEAVVDAIEAGAPPVPAGDSGPTLGAARPKTEADVPVTESVDGHDSPNTDVGDGVRPDTHTDDLGVPDATDATDVPAETDGATVAGDGTTVIEADSTVGDERVETDDASDSATDGATGGSNDGGDTDTDTGSESGAEGTGAGDGTPADPAADVVETAVPPLVGEGEPEPEPAGTTGGGGDGSDDGDDAGTVTDDTTGEPSSGTPVGTPRVNVPPVIGGEAAGDVLAGEAFRFAPSASDADGDALVWTIEGLPGWATFDAASGVLAGTPGLDDVGLFAGIVVGVTDGEDAAALAPFDVTVVRPNAPPVIAGLPTTRVVPGEPYRFVPEASDPEGAPLAFTVRSLPAWAAFDPDTGAVSGDAVPEGLDEGIEISVGDGEHVVALAPFFVRSAPLADLAASHGIATQGSIYGTTAVASRAIDGDIDTNNHTGCADDVNWWQVELPPTTSISRVEIVGQSSWTSRLAGASVTLSAASRATGAPLEAPIGTLAGTAALQALEPDAPVNARYVIVEAADARCLHMREVRVFGDTAQAPVFRTDELALTLPFGTVPGTDVGSLGVRDYQDDDMTVRLVDGDFPFSIDGDRLVLARAVDHNVEREWRFDVEATDGVNVSRAAVHVTLGEGNGVRVERWDSPADGYPSGPLDGTAHAVEPNRVFTTERVELPSDGWKYRQLLEAVLVPETSGERLFALAADDTATLWLTPVERGGEPVRIVAQGSATGEGDWSSATVSEPVPLEAGRAYRLAVLHVESSGDDHVALGWRRPDETAFAPVPHEVLHVDALSAGVVQPTLHAPAATTLLSGTAGAGDTVTSVVARDPQGDALALTIDADVPFAVEPDGRIVVSGTLATGARYTFDVAASDGTHRATTTLVVDTTADTALADALASGDASRVTTGELVDAIAATAEGFRTSREQLYRAVFGIDGTGATVEDTGVSLGALDWTLNHDAVFYESTDPGANHPLLVSNASYKSETASSLEVPVAMAGVSGNGARHAAFGSNVLAGVGVDASNEAMHTVTRRLLAWLLEREVSTLEGAGLNVVVAHQTNSYWFRHDAATHDWFATHYPSFTVNAVDACDNGALDGCLATADVLVMGLDEPATGAGFDVEATMRAVRAARDRGVPLLFLQADGGLNALGGALMDELGLVTTDNYWFKERLVGFDPATLATTKPASDRLVEAVANIDAGRIDVVYDEVSCTSYVGTVTCHAESMDNGFGGTLQTSVFDGIEYLRNAFAALDARGVDVFDLGTGHRLFKLAALLGDRYRDEIRYPMDKETTDPATFYRALFGDYAINYARANNRAQPDMGSFTDGQAALAAAEGRTRTLALTPEHESGWVSTGLYVPPGRPVTVRRTDEATTALSVKVNFLRHSTRVWNRHGYGRPRYVTSRAFAVAAGGSATLSTPYGGPLYVWLDGVEGPPAPLALEIEGVIDNPLLAGVAATDIAGFLSDVESTDSDWVDLVTPYVEIHSLKRHMTSAFAGQDGDGSDGYELADVQDYVADLNGYLIAGNYALAGYTGEGLPALADEVVAWCVDSGFGAFPYEGETRDLCTDPALHPKRRKQHVNSDVTAACGGLCAGNPFDSGYAIGPLGWGENHEMGHNLQRNRLNIYGGRSGEVSNNLFPIHTLWKWTIDEGLDRHPDGRGGDHAGAFAQLQAAIAAGTPADASHPTWAGTGTYANNGARLAFYEQLVWTHGSWSVYTKLYLLERLFTDAIRSEARWAALGGALGFDGYTLEQARAIDGNDFMYVAASRIEGRDYRDLFAAWGIATSDGARAQVASYGLAERVPAALYHSAVPVTAALPGDTELVPLDGTSAWADPTP